ncbi:MAG: hypothetical protein LBI87_00955 [Candidatus Accumulibacter sp.]|jgi:putative DNA primase/helicase|nr:hypothetical protein [Accumulibacter sp.]
MELNVNGELRYDLDMAQKNIERSQLVAAIGEKNADAFDARKGKSGVLKSKGLASGHGLIHGENSIERGDEAQLKLERDRLGSSAETKRIDIENLAEKAREQDDANRLAVMTGQNPDFGAQHATEREKNRQAELLEKVWREYRVTGNNYYFKDRSGRLAFRDQGKKLIASTNDERVAFAMATMADARGWKTIKVNGHPDFCRDVWIEASLRGIHVKGYTPQQQDLAVLEKRRKLAMRNTEELDEERRKANAAKSDRHKIAEAVAAVVVAEKLNGQNTGVQQQVFRRIQRELEQRARNNHIPTIPVYDKNAPPHQKGVEHIRPQVEHSPERTR